MNDKKILLGLHDCEVPGVPSGYNFLEKTLLRIFNKNYAECDIQRSRRDFLDAMIVPNGEYAGYACEGNLENPADGSYFAFAEQIKVIADHQNIPYVVFSGNNDFVRNLVKRGVNAIEKPFMAKDLMSMLKESSSTATLKNL